MAVDVGDRIGSYKLVSLLGEGGMGRVFAAEHAIIGRRAAIKVLRSAASADERLIERLFDEARAAHRVPHPGIVEVYDCGVAPFIGPFLIMELLEGESLAQSLRAQRNPEQPWSATILAQIAGALDATHRAGLVHRDLKPANVFLTGDGRVKLLDFGIAQLHEGALRADQAQQDTAGANAERTQAKRQGGVFGTPHFMSPEQIRGEAASPAMDVYALGVLAFVLLVGRLPFYHPESREVLRLQREETPPSPRRYRPSLPEALDGVLFRALAKQASERFTSCGSLVRALIEALGLRHLAGGLPLGALEALASGELTLSAANVGLPLAARLAAPPSLAALAEAEEGGSPLGFAATEPGYAPPTDVTAPLCPRCGDAVLSVRTIGDVEVDGCGSCGGIWFDEGELEHVAAESLGGDEGPGFDQLEQRRQVGWLRCPTCDGCLERRVLADYDALTIDYCTACAGYWLDGDELAELQRGQAKRLGLP